MKIEQSYFILDDDVISDLNSNEIGKFQGHRGAPLGSSGMEKAPRCVAGVLVVGRPSLS